jgi:hypothetical protein
MNFRRLACLLLGLWLGGSAFMAMVAAENFRSVDRLLAHPAPLAAQHIEGMGPTVARMFLRYQAAEQNRWYFETWDSAQIVIGLLLLFVLLFGTGEGKFTLALPVLMLGVALVDRLLLTPAIIAQGRLIDFVPPGIQSLERNRFQVMHGAYSSLEIAKWVLGLVLAGKLLVLRRRSHRAGDEFHMVDKADHRHVDR